MEVSKPSKTVYLEMGIWYNSETNHIHMAAKDVPGFHTTVSGNPASELRWHPNLFNKLARILKEAGVPSPELLTVDRHRLRA